MTKYEAVHPTVVSENDSSSGMLIIKTINRTVCINIYLKGPNNQRHSKWISKVSNKSNISIANVGQLICRLVGISVTLNLVQLITQEHFASEASNLVGR